MENQHTQETINSIIKENEQIMHDAEHAAKEADEFSQKNGITYEDIESEIKKLPKELQDEIIHEANEISKSVVADMDTHAQAQKRKINRKMSRYKNRI